MSWLKLRKQEGVTSQRLEGLWDVGLLSGVGLLDGRTPQTVAGGGQDAPLCWAAPAVIQDSGYLLSALTVQQLTTKCPHKQVGMSFHLLRALLPALQHQRPSLGPPWLEGLWDAAVVQLWTGHLSQRRCGCCDLQLLRQPFRG